MDEQQPLPATHSQTQFENASKSRSASSQSETWMHFQIESANESQAVAAVRPQAPCSSHQSFGFGDNVFNGEAKLLHAGSARS